VSVKTPVELVDKLRRMHAHRMELIRMYLSDDYDDRDRRLFLSKILESWAEERTLLQNVFGLK
jgi:hypothetical protein